MAESGADLSADGRYRYRLWRTLGPRSGFCRGTVLFVMLNPSTADALNDDHTIRKCMGFGRRFGFHRLEVVNLFAYRTTDPKGLLAAKDPVGSGNDWTIAGRCLVADSVIAAWGNTDFKNRMVSKRATEVRQLMREVAPKAMCLGWTKNGQPRHPLMLPYSCPFEPLESGMSVDAVDPVEGSDNRLTTRDKSLF